MSVINKPNIIIIILIQLLCHSVKAQEFISSDIDPWSKGTVADYMKHQSYYKAFMIKEDSSYSVTVESIITFKEGYLIKGTTLCNGEQVEIIIVSPKLQIFNADYKQKIKKGDVVSLRLHRYFFVPACITCDDVFPIDVMLGGKTIGINQDGRFSYLFATNDLVGLYLKIETVKDNQIRLIKMDKDAIGQCVYSFVHYFIYEDRLDPAPFLDTLKLKKSLQKYSEYTNGRVPYETYKRNQRKWHKGTFDKMPPYYHWKQWDGIDQNRFDEIFWQARKGCRFYNLKPIKSDSTLKEVFYKDMRIKILYCNYNEIYTIQIFANIPETGDSFVAIVDIQKYGNEFKVIGLNKYYKEYNILNSSSYKSEFYNNYQKLFIGEGLSFPSQQSKW